MRLLIDPALGWTDPAKDIDNIGLIEEELTLSTSAEVKRLIQARGHSAVLSTSHPLGLTPPGRTKLLNSTRPDLVFVLQVCPFTDQEHYGLSMSSLNYGHTGRLLPILQELQSYLQCSGYLVVNDSLLLDHFMTLTDLTNPVILCRIGAMESPVSIQRVCDIQQMARAITMALMEAVDL